MLTAVRSSCSNPYAANGNNEKLKDFAQKTLPALKHHLQLAQKLPDRAPGAQVKQPVARPQQQSGLSEVRGSGPIASLGPNYIVASDLTGTNVYGARGEDIGEINEVILSRDGKVVAVVVGVGGFLGIGEKDVAIPFNAIEIQAKDDTNSPVGGRVLARDASARADVKKGTTDPQRIVLRGMTKEDLESAPAFERHPK